tara:strand:+ start:22007 stop:22231 length:225 start_codon:yes stop_codon:yes gene_type:complete
VAKEISEKTVHLGFTVRKAEGSPAEVSGVISYDVSSDGISENRSMDLKLTDAQETQVKTFAGKALADAKSKEGA